MSTKTLKNTCRVYQRTGIHTIVIGGHAAAKTSAINQLYFELAEEKGVDLEKVVTAVNKSLSTKVKNPDSVTLSADLKNVSSIDSKHLSRDVGDLDTFKFWSVNAQSMTIEELIGMPHVTDFGEIYRQTFFKAQDIAMKFAESEEQFEVLRKEWHKKLCHEQGLTEDDIGRVELKYLRIYEGLIPDPRHRGGGIWLVDELNRGFVEIEKGFMQLFNEGRYLDYILPDNVWIVTTMNPPGSIYPTARDLDPATLNRVAVLEGRGDIDEFLKHAADAGYGDEVRTFADKNKNLVNKHEKELEVDLGITCTFRTLQLVDRAWTAMSQEEIKTVGQLVVNGLIGLEAGHLFYKTATERVHRPLTVEDVIDGYGWDKKMDEDEEKDYKSWNVSKNRLKLHAMIKRANVKTELINITLRDLAIWFKEKKEELEKRGSTKSDWKHTPEERGEMLNALLFLYDIPADMSRKFLMEDMDGLYEICLYWAGRHQVVVDLHKRIESEYKSEEAK